jgi:hypothetical protein
LFEKTEEIHAELDAWIPALLGPLTAVAVQANVTFLLFVLI